MNPRLIQIILTIELHRLVSAYRDKGVNNQTFEEFINNVLAEYDKCSTTECNEMDLHWRPYTRICSFCQFNYTVISKMETFDEDMKMILEMVGIHSHKIHLHKGEEHDKIKIHGDSSTSKLTGKLFETLEDDTKVKLREIYRMDFELFDYNQYLY